MLHYKLVFLLLTCTTVAYACKSCNLSNKQKGECVSFTKCPELQLLQHRTNILINKFQWINKARCNQFSVCCPNANLSSKDPKRIRKSISSLRTDQSQCGVQHSSNRIFGGTITDLHEFPWMALLIYQTDKGPALACGGVLIDRKYVLTAAHCVTGASVKTIGKLLAVRLGEHDINSPIDCDDSEIDKDCALPHVDLFVEQAIPHPMYISESRNRYNDIALIKLKDAVNYTKDVQPICLPKLSNTLDWNKPGANLYISGWGQTETKLRSSIKLKAEVPVVKDEVCAKPYAKNGIRLGSTQICAGGDAKDSCKGDSGGPLMFEDVAEARWYAVGVTSFGAQPCATVGVPAVYTGLRSYSDWIHSTILALNESS